ncbi:hypothetical protein DFH07DRAFT_708495, partial [Mycena maculata]
FPWAQLTHIDIGDCSPNDCLQILEQASTAIACSFEIRRDSSLQHSPLITHSQLEVLKIYAYVHLRPLWSRLTCPALISLSIESSRRQGLAGLLQFFTRSGETIENVKLIDCGLSDNQFMSCLRDLPLLRRLDVS